MSVCYYGTEFKKEGAIKSWWLCNGYGIVRMIRSDFEFGSRDVGDFSLSPPTYLMLIKIGG